MRVFSSNLTLLGTVTDVRANQAQFDIVCRGGDKFTMTVTPLTFFTAYA